MTLDAAAKYTMTVADYSGVRAGALVYADFAETVNRAGHPTPTVDAPAGSWVVSYWADKSADDDRVHAAGLGDRPPGPLQHRHRPRLQLARRLQRRGADGSVRRAGRPRPTRPTRRRRPGRSSCARIEPNQAPTASFTYDLRQRGLRLRRHDSSDPDGSVVSYAWDFGDGGTATGATPSHDFVTSGTRDVTLTVTDDEGTTGLGGHPGRPVVRTNAAPDGVVHDELHLPGLHVRRRRVGRQRRQRRRRTPGTSATARPTPRPASRRPTPTTLAGPYVVTLTVTDNDSGTGQTTRNVAPVAIRPIALVGSTVNQGNVSTPNTTVPAATAAGDRLIAGAQPQQRHEHRHRRPPASPGGRCSTRRPPARCRPSSTRRSPQRPTPARRRGSRWTRPPSTR